MLAALITLALLTLAALGLAGWATYMLRRVLGALAVLQNRELPALPGFLPMTRETVDKVVEEALRAYENRHDVHRLVVQAMLDQAAREISSKMAYDNQQRATAVAQLLEKACHARGLQVPQAARDYVKGAFRV